MVGIFSNALVSMPKFSTAELVRLLLIHLVLILGDE